VLVVASPAAGADRRHLTVLLERGERHLPSLAEFLVHAGMMAQAGGPRYVNGWEVLILIVALPIARFDKRMAPSASR
jgi:hypothetical protein